ncbi:MAG: Fe-S cluster assembly ATPase SufC, partial [Acidimicrobiia bacterium]
MDPAPLFEIESLRARPAEADPSTPDILRGVDLTVRAGEVHALMGPNGSGKSTLASTLLASPEYVQTGGSIRFKGDDISSWDTEVRGKAGIFLAFQYPQAIQGVSVINFLRQALSARKGIDLSVLELRLAIMEWMARLDMDPSFADRFLNEGFSGGEKKRNEILQMAILEPEVAILDETDSGLDIDALKVVAKGVQEVRAARPGLGVLAITHYQRLLDHLRPDV